MSTDNKPISYIMKLIDLKLHSDQLREEFANVVEDNHIAASRMFNKLLDDILYVTVSCPGIRYWQQGTDVWASTRNEINLDKPESQRPYEITIEEFQQLRRSEWAQLAPQPKEEPK